MASLSNLLRHTATYSMVPVLGKLLGFLLIPFYAGYLKPAEYGVMGMTDLVLIGMQQLLGQNLMGAMTRFYYDQPEGEQRNLVVSTITLVISSGAWLVCGALLWFTPQVAWLFYGAGEAAYSSEQLQTALRFALCIVPLQLSTLAGLQYLMIRQMSARYSQVQLIKLALELGLKIVLIGVFDLGLAGFFWSVLIGEALASLCVTGWMLSRVKLRIHWPTLRPILAYTLPLIPVGLSQLGLHQLDRRLLKAWSTYPNALDIVGVYSIGYLLGSGVNYVVHGPFMQTWLPWIYAVQDERERASKVAKVSTYSLIVVAGASLAVMCFSKQTVLLLMHRANQETYRMAWQVVPWVAAGYVFWSVYQTAQLPLLIAKRTQPLLWMNLVALAANVGLNYWFVPRLGLIGPALSTLLTFTLLAAMVMLQSRAVAGVHFELRRMLGILAVMLGAGGTCFWIDIHTHGNSLGNAAALSLKSGLLLTALFLYWKLVLKPEERVRAWGWAAARLGRG